MAVTLTKPCESVQGMGFPYTLKPTNQDESDIGSRLRPLLLQLEAELGYNGATPSHELNDLLQAMHEHAAHVGFPYPEGSVSWKAFKVGLCYAHVSIYTMYLFRFERSCLSDSKPPPVALLPDASPGRACIHRYIHLVGNNRR